MSFSIRTRLAVWYAVLLAVILGGLSVFLVLRLRADLVTAADRSLDTRAAQVSLGYQAGVEGEFQDVADATLVRLPVGEGGAQLLSVDGQVLESSGDRVAEAPMLGRSVLTQVTGGEHVRISVALGPDHELFRLLAVSAPHRPKTEVLVVASSLEEVSASIHRLLVLLLLAGPAVLAAVALGGWWVARKALLPVARMTREASSIGIEGLDERVAVPPVNDELARLARTLNAMLDRLERGVEEKRRFVADASHELRTPLAVMRSELEVSLRSDDLPPSAHDVLASAAEEVERMSCMVENMLTLARMDEGKLQLLKTTVDLDALGRTVVDDLRPLAERKGVRLNVDGGKGSVRADRERLYQVVANLVDNGVKYGEPGGSVHVSVWRRGSEAGLTVADTGPGIPAAVLPRIFDRFVRADPARSTAEGGTGLGLAICRGIVEAHGGRIWAESELGNGSTFSVAFPAASDDADVRVPMPSRSAS
jgi:heavy metal sensor kinase